MVSILVGRRDIQVCIDNIPVGKRNIFGGMWNILHRMEGMHV